MSTRQTSGRVLVASATGEVGRAVVASLVRRGLPVRAGGAQREAWHVPEGAEAVRLDLGDAASWGAALEGCTSVFATLPSALPDAQPLLRFFDACAREGVHHIVFLSVAGAPESPLVPHHLVELHLRHLGRAAPTYTLLRPGVFSQTLGTTYREDVAADDRLYVPAGRARVAFVDCRDVAEVAATVFTDPRPHRRKAYTLTGPEALSFEEAARLLTDALGRTIRYVPASIVDYARHLRSRGIPLARIAVDTMLHVGLRYGRAETVDETLPLLLGRRATTCERYIQDHVHLWQRAARAPRSAEAQVRP